MYHLVLTLWSPRAQISAWWTLSLFVPFLPQGLGYALSRYALNPYVTPVVSSSSLVVYLCLHRVLDTSTTYSSLYSTSSFNFHYFCIPTLICGLYDPPPKSLCSFRVSNKRNSNSLTGASPMKVREISANESVLRGVCTVVDRSPQQKECPGMCVSRRVSTVCAMV